MLATKSIEKIHDANNAKECCNSYLKRKNKKFVKQLKIIAQQSKTIEHPNIVDIKLLQNISKTLHELFKTIRQTEKISQVSDYC